MSKIARVLTGIYLLYLRKSRADNPDETIEEVLAKHEAILQEFMLREYGFKIPEENIYREVCSGESIDERAEMRKVLARMEEPEVLGVVCIEPQRLSRGDLTDCGRLITNLKYTQTQVITPTMTYNLENKMEQKFFQDELLRGRDYLEYTKEILLRGRVAAVKRGCYIGTRPPYGFNKVKIGKDNTLEPNKESDVVRLIFELFVNEGLTYYQICCRLTEMGIASPKGNGWNKDTVRHILRNEHYIGKVFFFKIKGTVFIENGEKTTKKISQPKEEMVIANGKHPAIVDEELFKQAQERISNNPKAKIGYPLQNPLAGILKCGICGRTLIYHPYKTASTRVECRKRPTCSKSAKLQDVIDTVVAALEYVELPKLEAKLKNNEGSANQIKKKLLENLEKQLAEFKDQEEKQYEFLETGRYSEELFERRNTALRCKIEQCQQQIRETRASIPKEIDYSEKIISLKKAIEAMKDDRITPEVKNKFLRAIVERIDYINEGKKGKGKKGDTQLKLDIYLRL